MIVTYQQIIDEMNAARAAAAASLVGSRICLHFCHEISPGVRDGICGLYGWIYAHLNPNYPDDGTVLRIKVTYDTHVEGFYIVDNDELRVRYSREQHMPDSTVFNIAEDSDDIDDVIYGKKKLK